MSVVIESRGLSKHYGTTVALRDLDLDVREGEILGYLGPNGAGKTTTIRLFLGLIEPTAGSATIFGLDATRHAPEIHRRVAYVPGEASLWPGLTGAETLALLGRVHGQVDERYRDELIARFDFDPLKKVRSYSKGNRQKLSLIAALMTRAELLILDEPTAGLDPLMERTFRDCMRESRERGQTVFLSSHILSEVEALCDRVGILREGELLQLGTLAQLRHLSALTVHITFDGPAPDLTGVAGVSNVAIEGPRLSCEVDGPIQPLLDAIAGSRVRELLSAKPSLEELFLSHYGAAHAVETESST